MAAYLDAIAPEVWLATNTGFTGTPTSEQLKWNAKARNAIFEAISEEVFAIVNGMDLANDIWKELIEIHEGSTKVREQKYHLFRAKYDSFKMSLVASVGACMSAWRRDSCGLKKR